MLPIQSAPKLSEHATSSATEDQGSRKRKRPRSDRGLDATHSKNSIKRISRACDTCRLKKNRCDGAQPTCSQCAAGGVKCMYGAQVRKRGLPTGYVRVLEALWAITLKLVPNSEATALTLLKSVFVRYDEEENRILESDHITSDEPLRKIWAQSQLRKRIDQMVGQFENGTESSFHRHHHDSLLKSSMSSLDDRTVMPFAPWCVGTDSSVIGKRGSLASKGINFDESVHKQQEDSQRSISWQHATPKIHSVDGLSVSGEEHPFPVAMIRPQYTIPDTMWTLIDTYFGYTHCWFPIVQKHTVMKIASSLQDDIEGDPGEIALVFAVMAVGSSHDNPVHGDMDESDAQVQYQVALRSISCQKFDSCALTIAQVFLLLSIVDMARGRWEAASNLVGRATRIMLLWEDSKHEPLGTPSGNGLVALSKRVTLGCFILDTIASAHLRALPHLRSLDMDRFFDFDEDGPDEWEQWFNKTQQFPADIGLHALSHQQQTPLRILSTFKEYARLLLVLNDAICTAFLRTVVSQADQERFMAALESWVLNLPRHNKLTPQLARTQTSNKTTPPTANLHLTYAIVLLYLEILAHSTRNDAPFSKGSQVSHICATTLEAYEQAVGRYQCKGMLLLFTGLRSHTDTLESYSVARYNTHQIDVLDIPTRYGIGSVGPRPDIDQTLNQQSCLRDMDILATCDPEQELTLPTAFPQGNGFGSGHQNELMEVEEASPLINRRPQIGEMDGDDMACTRNDLDTISVDMASSMSQFNRFQDAGTVESLLEELSSINDNDWAMMPSQFMYNLGFYDTEVNGP